MEWGRSFALGNRAAGETVQITLTPDADLDVAAELIDPAPNYSVIAQLNDVGPGGQESGVLVLPKDGDYLLIVRSEASTNGRVEIDADDVGVSALDAGETLQNPGGDGIDLFRFDATRGQLVSFDVDPADDVAVVIDVFSATSREPVANRHTVGELGPGAGQRFEAVVPATGEYLVYVRTTGDESGGYTITRRF